MSFVESIQEHVRSVDADAQLTGTLLANRRQGSASRPEYFYLKDMVNPQQAYWEHLDESPPLTDELRRLFAYGKLMGRVADRAFSSLDGFTDAEAILDGAENGLPGIRGKIDFRYGDSLVEFKTTRYRVDTSEDVWESTPQDIEQLLFYAALWTYDVPTHFLIFHIGDIPNSIRVFEVEIENQGLIRNTLRSRKTNLERALEVEDPSILRQCRYFDGECHVNAAGLCTCDEYDELNIEPLQRATELERNNDLETRLTEAFRDVQSRPDTVRPWDLETPRRWFGLQVGDRERESWTPDELWVPDALSSAGLLPGPLENPYPSAIDDPIHFSPTGSMIQSTRTTSDGVRSRWVPALVRIRDYDSTPEPYQIRNQIMQIGCACSLSNTGTGYVIIELPNADEEIVAYKVTFEDLGGIRRKIRERLEDMDTALNEEDESNLPMCPDWLQDDCEECLCT